MLRTRIALGCAVASLGLLSGASAVGAQGYDDDVAQVPIGSATADETGTASGTFDLPDDLTEPWEIVAVGEDPDGEERIVLVTNSGGDESAAAATAPTGDVAPLSASAVRFELAQVADSITVSATGFRPGSQVLFVVRYVPAQAAGGGSGGGGFLPRTGSEVAAFVGVGAGLVVLGAAAFAGARRRASSVGSRS
jgi:LPXTG-motif cell wall-anchored protein